ncbi:MAG TPA: ATP-binding protein [Elusimicrobiota bacterium]|nr:ATP-binding protein [Elusimicrobiota bacterium]
MKEELRAVFVDESLRLLKELRDGLARVRERPEALAELFRCAHMLKGDVKFAGFRELEMIASPLADSLKASKERGGIDPGRIALLREGAEACERLLDGRTVPGFLDLVERLNRAAAQLREEARPRSALTILLIEDSELQAQVVQRELMRSRRTSFSVEQASRLADGLERASRGGVDAVLLDLNLPDSQGVETFVRLSARVPALPVVILTISDDDALAVEALRRGAQDYLVKSQIDSELLSRVIRYAVERKRIEAVLRQAQADLELRVTERTAELTRSNEALKRSNTELVMFASSASHELQEPVRKIVGYADILKELSGGSLDAQALDYLRKIRDGGLRLGELIQSLRELTRVTMSSGPLEPVDLDVVLGDVLADVAPRLIEIGGRVEAGALPAVKGDALQLGQLFRNLIGNSVKYRDADRRLIVEISARRPEPGWIEISVADNGIGFEQRHAEQIFKPFERLHGRGRYEGIGMGLAITARIVWRHGGAISARSEPGKGSVFTLRLPAWEARA